ncbi:MAG: hypothetical protein EZS28_017289 [Streblomastix strix]|uniref:Uncharacterized protein n=1 Tax=Streblomastix strix TaxID=222440 RepID=A0A5J4VXV9_9EUKA|nr:MAG: hypothetical protein EZS28_017289 [Streblomastix strix]
MTLEKGPKRPYNRKSNPNEKAKALNDQMINEQTNEHTNEKTNDQQETKEQSEFQSDFDVFYEIFSECFTKANEQIQSKTIKERIDGAIIDQYEYRKFADPKLKNKLLTEHFVDLIHHLASLHNILGHWNVDLTAKKDDDISNSVSYESTLEAMPIEIADTCIQSLKELTIHFDTNTLSREISLLPLFMGLNRLEQTKDKQYKEDAYIIVYRDNILTPKANEYWSDRQGRYSSRANT